MLGLDVVVTFLMCFLSFFRETVQPSLLLWPVSFEVAVF